MALLEDQKLVELQRERRDLAFAVGDIYLGRVKKVMPGLNAAFVDVGYKKDAFLHYLDLGMIYQAQQRFLEQIEKTKAVPALHKIPNFPDLPKDGKIADYIKAGQNVLVQVVKEPISTKGPRLSAEISIAGRNLVLVPFSDKVSVSTKIESHEERTRLKQLVLSMKPKNFSVIIRTSWLFSEYGNNFVKTMIRLAGERDNLSIVHDQTGSPTYAGDLAQAIITLLQQPVAPRGIYHYGGNKSVTWYEFAQAIFQAAQQQAPNFKIPQLNAITTDQYPLPAPRPAYSIMDCQKIENECGIKASDWQKALNEIIGKLDN